MSCALVGIKKKTKKKKKKKKKERNIKEMKRQSSVKGEKLSDQMSSNFSSLATRVFDYFNF
jgi:hypothetical protein